MVPALPSIAASRACLPPPKGLSQAQLDELQAKSGVVWCRACVPIEGHLTLDDVRRIERAGNVQLCATPPRQLPRYGSGAGDPLKSYTRVRELYRALPPAEEDPDAVAVIIGNRNYAKLPPSETSQNDAGAIYAFLTEHLGYRPDNIIDVRDAKKADLEKLFGARGPVSRASSRGSSRPSPTPRCSSIIRGTAPPTPRRPRPISCRSTPSRIARSSAATSCRRSTPISRGSTPSRCSFCSRRSTGGITAPYVLPPNLPETMNTALPRAPMPALTVLAASDRGQRTLIDMTYDIGLFTRYLIEGLAGGADLPPIGNGDGELDSAEIYVFTAAMVDLAARKTFGLLQHPVYSSAATSVLHERPDRPVALRLQVRSRPVDFDARDLVRHASRQIVGGARENRFTRGPGFHTGPRGS